MDWLRQRIWQRTRPASRAVRALSWTAALLALVLVSAACSLGSTSGGTTGGGTTGGATATPTPPPCNTRATTTAVVWSEGQQIHGGIGGAAPAQLSTFSYPLGLPDEGFEGNQTIPGVMVVSPDGAHIAVDQNVFVPFTEESYPYVVNTSTHAASRVMLPAYPWTPDEETRLLAWADNHTLIVFQGLTNRSGGATSSYSYDITTSAATPLPGIANAVEGEVRCSTLYWLEVGSFTQLSASDPNHDSTAPARVHRYDLASHSEIGTPISIGSAWTSGGAEGQVALPGWDVSRDGSTLVSQHMTVTFSGGTLHVASQFFAAHSDGSSSAAILAGPPPVTSSSPANLSISPDGTKVAVTGAQSTPTVATGPISGGGGTLFYSPDANGPPAWLPDGSGFLAATQTSTPDNIYQYLLSTPPVSGRIPGSQVHANAQAPATLP